MNSTDEEVAPKEPAAEPEVVTAAEKEAAGPVFDASTYVVNDGDFLIHVALRRKHFLPGAVKEGWLTRLYEILNTTVVGANSPTVHHYELVCWFSHNQDTPFHAGCLHLSFDWLQKEHLGTTIDNLLTLFKERPARLSKQNWYPNVDPSEDDLLYKYIYVGNRRVNNHDIFAPFVDKMTGRFLGGIDLNEPFWEQHYTLTGTCCYSFAEKVISKFLNNTFDRTTISNDAAWVDYPVFCGRIGGHYPKPAHCACATACRCISAGRSKCRCDRTCTCSNQH
jgi:hypothetical protein